MPTLWRFLLKSYFKVFLLCMASFITALFVMRFKDIAEFAALGSSAGSVFLFSLYQLPYVLPLAIPVSCVIASMLLFRNLSHHHELTALRAAGIGIRSLLVPLMLSALLLSAFNFAIVAELGPRCRLWAKELTFEITSNNPFYIFKKITEGKLTNAYIEIRALRGGKKAKEVLLILNNRAHQRLGIMTADELSIEGETLFGKKITLISSVDSTFPEGFDHLVIENQDSMSTPATTLSQLLHGATWHLRPEYLPFRDLLIRLAISHKSFWSNTHSLEVARRLSLALTPLIFTFLGAAFGMKIGRGQTRRSLLWTAALTTLYLSAFIGAKSMKHFPKAAWALYFLPFLILCFFSLRSLKRVSRGTE